MVFVISGVLGYTFIFKGNAFLGEDGRTTIVLTETEKAKVLGEMRNLLEGVQIIIGAIAADDMELVAEAATSLGIACRPKNETVFGSADR